MNKTGYWETGGGQREYKLCVFFGVTLGMSFMCFCQHSVSQNGWISFHTNLPWSIKFAKMPSNGLWNRHELAAAPCRSHKLMETNSQRLKGRRFGRNFTSRSLLSAFISTCFPKNNFAWMWNTDYLPEALCLSSVRFSHRIPTLVLVSISFQCMNWQ